jgi:hypothetical protein
MMHFQISINEADDSMNHQFFSQCTYVSQATNRASWTEERDDPIMAQSLFAGVVSSMDSLLSEIYYGSER